jgi:C-terminal peptidase prc
MRLPALFSRENARTSRVAVSVFTLISLLLPSAAGAVSASGLLSAANAQPVSRGTFVAAVVVALGVPLGNDAKVPLDKGIPLELLPYIHAARERQALGVFGPGFDASKNISRGEAARVLWGLMDAQPTVKVSRTFPDVKTQDDRSAVNAVIALSWMRPVSARIFGSARPLLGREARLVLQRIQRQDSSSSMSAQPQRITVPLTSVPRSVPKDDVLNAVWNILNDEYLYKDRIDAEKASNGAIQGLVDSLHDPYTTYLPPTQYKNFQDQLKGEVLGIGAMVEQTGGVLRVIAPLPGSPAEKAGLKPKDEIRAVDGASIAGLTLDEGVAKIRGPKGTSVLLHIRRDGTELDVSVTRDLVKISDVDVTYQDNIAIVKIAQFGDVTDTTVRQKFTEIAAKHPRGIVIDLRNNPGGLLHAAGVVASNFLPKGSTYVTIASRTDTQAETTTEAPTVDASVPLVLLVNKGSASASEVVTGALQDAKRATVVGEKTYGKGTVQQIEQFSDGSSLKLTIAEWKTPLGRKIDGLGIEPDISVPLVAGDRDAQLLKALDLLR